MTPTVTLVQRVVPQYRRRLFDLMRADLAAGGVHLDLITGDGQRRQGGSHVPPPWATVVEERSLRIGHKRLEYLPVLPRGWRSDAVILEQASRAIHTNALLAMPSRAKIALWGHGANLQHSTASPLGEWWKQRILGRADWFFAYTPGTRSRLLDAGFPEDRITTLHNTIDGSGLRARIDECTPDSRRRLLAEAGLRGSSLTLHVGRLYDLKRPGFLVEAAIAAREQLDDFELVVIGDGPAGDPVRRAAAMYPWFHHCADLEGPDIAPWIHASRLMLLPGMVGLSAVDALATGLPVVSIDEQEHSPEFEYLRDLQNARILSRETDPLAFGGEVARLLRSQGDELLRRTAVAESGQFRIETMASEFVEGIHSLLERPR